MTSKMVTLRQRKGRAVEAAMATHGEEVVRVVEEKLAPLVEDGETVPDLAFVLTLLRRLLSRSRQTMVEVDEAHLAVERIGRGRRRQRDRATAVLIDHVSDTRRLLEGICGRREAMRLTGLSGRTRRTPLEILRQAERLVGRLTDPDVEMPPVRLSGVRLDPQAVAAELRPPVQALRKALGDVDLYLRERESTLLAKAHTMGEFEATLVPVGQVLEGLLRLAGLEDFADRLRAFPRRPSSSDEPSEADGTDLSRKAGEEDSADADGGAPTGGGDSGSGEPAVDVRDGDAGGSGGFATLESGVPNGGDEGSVPPPAGPGGAVTRAAPS